MAAGPHVSLSAETLFSVGPLEVSNSILTSLLVSAFLIGIAALLRSTLVQTDRPKGFQNAMEWIVESLFSLVQSVTNDAAKTKVFLPLVATFFLFILVNNWSGLLPGVGTIGMHVTEGEEHAVQLISNVNAAEVKSEIESSHSENAASDEATHTSHSSTAGEDHAAETTHEIFVPFFRPGTADLNTTLALAIFTVFAVQFMGVRYLGISYFSKFVNFSSPIAFFVGFLEIISEFAKIISFAFRLFGNIFAGEVLLVVITYLAKIIAPMPFYGLEIFVGFIQALVFAMLSLVFYNMATESHH